MLTRKIASLDASAIGLGTWVMGGWMWGGCDDDEAIAAIHASIDAGVSLIDTAPAYGFGRCEELVGRAIEDRRDRVVLATKCGLRWDTTEGSHFFDSDTTAIREGATAYHVYRYLGPASIRTEIERSLKRLRSETIDLYQTHWPDQTSLVEDSMACLMDLRDEGKIREIGSSNASVSDLDAYRLTGELASTQEKFSLLDREVEEAVLPHCQEHGIALLAYSSLALGLLTGALDPEREFGSGDLRSQSKRFQPVAIRQANEALAQLQGIAEQHDTTISAVVIARTLQIPGVTHVLCGARNRVQALANAVAGTLRLSPEQCLAVDRAVALIEG